MQNILNTIDIEKASIAFNQTNLYTIAEESPSLDYLAMHKIKFQVVLPELLAESNQKIAVQNARAHFSNSTFREADYLSSWQPGRDWGKGLSYFNKPTAFTHSELAKREFAKIKDKFCCDEPSAPLSQLQIRSNASNVESGLLERKKYYGCGLNTHPQFDQVLDSFGSLFWDLNLRELEFLSSFIQWDEQGVLVLLSKYICLKLGCVLASKMMVALYTPGAFVEFFAKVLSQMTLTKKEFLGYGHW